MLPAMTIKGDHPPSEAGRGPVLMAIGGLLGALAASSCCILPIVLFGLGVSGAWIGNLTQLAPYQPYIIAATLAFLGGGYWLVIAPRKSPAPMVTPVHASCPTDSSRPGSFWPRCLLLPRWASTSSRPCFSTDQRRNR